MTTAAHSLLIGPRGRRLCLGYAMRIDAAIFEVAMWASHRAPGSHSVVLFIGDGDPGDVAEPSITHADVAARIDAVHLTDVDDHAVDAALRDSVDSAMYWQPPDGYDVVAADPAVRASLRPIAEAIASSASARDWADGRGREQWAVQWCALGGAGPIGSGAASVLEAWASETRAEEGRAARERPRDPQANWSGTWWSVPQQLLLTRGRVESALDLVEDSSGWERATVIPVRGAGRTLEIASAADWAELCRAYPLEVTASRRHDWFRVTGREGRWLIPDWQRIARDWDAAHLTTRAYLAAATTSIEIDDEYASVIAGWAPDSTIWLTDVAEEDDRPREEWVRDPETGGWGRSASGQARSSPTDGR